MAGATLSPPLTWSRPPSDILGRFPIKSGEIVNQGDLVALDSNGQVVVATKTGPRALGVALLDDEYGGFTSHTGVGGLTVFASIARRAKIGGFTSTSLPGTQTIGNNVYLGPVTSATVSNFGMAGPGVSYALTPNDIFQCVGVLISTTGGAGATPAAGGGRAASGRGAGGGTGTGAGLAAASRVTIRCGRTWRARSGW